MPSNNRRDWLTRVCVVLSAFVGLALGLPDVTLGQTIQPAVSGTLADGGVFGNFDGVADSTDWTFNQSSYEGAITLSTATTGVRLEHRTVFEYDLSAVTRTPPVAASLSFSLRGASIFPMSDVVVQVYSYPAALKQVSGEFSAGPAVLQGSATIQAFQAATPSTLNVSSVVSEALSNGTKKVAFRFQVDPGTQQSANQAFIDAVDTDPASKPSLVISTVSRPTVVSAVSRKAHGTAGTFDINVASSSAVESRKDGPTQVVVTFSTPIQRLNGTLQDVSVSQGTVGSLAVNGATLDMGLSGAALPQTLTISFPGIADAANPAAAVTQTLCFRVLPGDATGDGTVNTSDYVAVRGHMGQAVDSTNCRNDVSGDGVINTSDYVTIRGKIGTTVGSCP